MCHQTCKTALTINLAPICMAYAYLRMTNCMKISDSVLMPRAMRYTFPMVNILLIRHRGWSSLCMKRDMSYNKVQVWYIPTG